MILGIVALSLALALGVGGAGLSPDQVFSAFPTSLFITIFSVTLLIQIAEGNGTFHKLTSVGIKLCRGHQRALPFLVFLVSAGLSALGLGNIATTALMAPAALAIGATLSLRPFLMILMVIGGANASVMSPFSPTGILARELLSRFPEALTADRPSNLWFFVTSFLMIGSVHLSGFLALGGGKWLRDMKPTNSARAPAPEKAWNQKQWLTLGILGAFFMLNLVFGIPQLRSHFAPSLAVLGTEVGFIAMLCVATAAVFRVGSIKTAAQRVPWDLLMMICGIATLVATLEKTFGFGAVTALAEAAGSAYLLITIVSLATATLSVFSSSSGVVMPLFLPMVPALVAGGLGVNPWLLATVIIVSSHLVDCSPFSSLGAIALASASDGNHDSKKLFRQLTWWGLSMIGVGAAVGGLVHLAT